MLVTQKGTQLTNQSKLVVSPPHHCYYPPGADSDKSRRTLKLQKDAVRESTSPPSIGVEPLPRTEPELTYNTSSSP